MSNQDKRQIIGTYQLPVAVANYLADEEQDKDMEDVLGDDLSYDVENWLESLPGLHNHTFTIVSERPDHVAHALFVGAKEESVTVVVSASLSNLDSIQQLFVTNPEKAASLCGSFKEIIGNVKPEQIPMAAPEAIKHAAESFPDEHSLKAVTNWAQFGSPLNQLLFVMLIQSNE